jgi:chloride channel protein, CIC family
LGYLLGIAGQQLFPEASINLSLAALVGMAALFAGSARALLTSIVFALETTMQERTLLPLISGCVTSYMVSYILMRGTIMTEKIKRRGVILPEHYVPDLLEINTGADALAGIKDPAVRIFSATSTVGELRNWLLTAGMHYRHNIVFVGNETSLAGTVSRATVFNADVGPDLQLSKVMSPRVYSMYDDNSLQLGVEFMLKTEQNILPVIQRSSRQLLGFISEHDVLKTFEQRFREDRYQHRHISMVRTTMRALSKGKKLFRRRFS